MLTRGYEGQWVGGFSTYLATLTNPDRLEASNLIASLDDMHSVSVLCHPSWAVGSDEGLGSINFHRESKSRKCHLCKVAFTI